jgi:hypothetical protein
MKKKIIIKKLLPATKFPDGSKNGEDITNIIIEQNAYLVVYKDSITERYFWFHFFGRKRFSKLW